MYSVIVVAETTTVGKLVLTHFHCTVTVEAVKPKMFRAATPMAAVTAVFVIGAVHSIATVANAAALRFKVVIVGLLSSSGAAMVKLIVLITHSAMAAMGLGPRRVAAKIIEDFVAIMPALTKSQTRLELECLNCSRIAAMTAITVAAIKDAVVAEAE